MTTNVSPISPFIFLPNADHGKDLVLKTQPFYSMFYYLDTPETNSGFRQKVRLGAQNYPQRNKTADGARSCLRVFREMENQPEYHLENKLPFSLFSASGVGAVNLYFLMVVFLATIVLGTITFSYWVYLLGNHEMDENFRNAIEKRSVYLSVLFVVMSVVMTVMFYEFFTLRFLSLKWFQRYEANEPTHFYDFLLNSRKIVLWVVLMIGLVMVSFVTTTLTTRSKQFTKQIVMNSIAVLILFCAQYLYYQNPSNKYIKTFSLFLSVSVIGFVMFLLYGT
jgi:hypothetical protein